tara:strand:+ start:431 stop:955 length:525 start_codon:yes stop_codon:yes gene_type:complete
MTGYELVFITDPSLSDKEIESVLKKIKKSFTKSGGKLIHEYVWGRRRLAYEISGNDFGVYHAWYFTGTGETVNELQRQFGYSDDVLRHQIMKTDDLDAEAAFLQRLIPPKEETSEKEKVPGVSADVEKEPVKEAEAKTDRKKSVADDPKKVETETEVKKEKPKVEDEKTETAEA